MPRLAPSLLHHARRKNPLLPILLRECRDRRSAENELRWLTEHAFTLQPPLQARTGNLRPRDATSAPGWRTTLQELVRRRARGEPLQYILGTQPFGELEIRCQRGVLIPRPETETYTITLAGLVQDLRREATAATTQKLRILDLCTGTGCISLLLHSLLQPPNTEEIGVKVVKERSFLKLDIQILGIDISETALRLAKKNIQHNIERGVLHSTAKHDVSFVQANVLDRSFETMTDQPVSQESEHGTPDVDLGARALSVRQRLQCEDLGNDWDILIANPPYISPRLFAPGGTTTRSVRRWEPQLALVPGPSKSSVLGNVRPTEREDQPERGDEFYPHLLELARSVDAKAVVLEIGDNEQALRVREMAIRCFAGDPDIAVEIWSDDGAVDTGAVDCDGNIPTSECRAVVLWRCSWAKWRLSTMGNQKRRKEAVQHDSAF